MQITKNKLLPSIHSDAKIETSLSQALINAYKGKLLLASIKFQLSSGTYAGPFTFTDLITKGDRYFEIEGDTRSLGGLGFVQGRSPATDNYANSGAGAITLSNSGNDITVARATTNPAFGTAGYGNGDKLLVCDNAGAITEQTISSVSGNVVTLSATAPTVGQTASAVCLVPNRIITGALTIIPGNARVRFKGFKFSSAGHNIGSSTDPKPAPGLCAFEQCVFFSNAALIAVWGQKCIFGKEAGSFDVTLANSSSSGNLLSGTGIGTDIDLRGSTLIGGYEGISLIGLAKVYAQNFNILFPQIGIDLEGAWARLVNGFIEMPATYGLYMPFAGGQISGTGMQIRRKSGSVSGRGVEGSGGCIFNLRNPTIEYFSYGIFLSNGGLAFTTGPTFTGCTTNTSPATSGSLGNNGAMYVG